MRKLNSDKRTQIISALLEGCSINSTVRMCGVSKLTVLRLLSDVGQLCRDLHDLMVKGVYARHIEADEIWSFVGCKQKTKNGGGQGDGNAWIWVGMDADTRLVLSYLVGLRDEGHAFEFMHDIKSRITSRPQITTDAHKGYLGAILDTFGRTGVEYAQLEKYFGLPYCKGPEARYSPLQVTGVRKVAKIGNPNMARVSTSYVERSNLGVRMNSRRFTRLTNGFSKKWANHEHAIALHYFWYNFGKVHTTLKKTPAMAARLAAKPWTIADLVAALEKEERLLTKGGRINRADRT